MHAKRTLLYLFNKKFIAEGLVFVQKIRYKKAFFIFYVQKRLKNEKMCAIILTLKKMLLLVFDNT